MFRTKDKKLAKSFNKRKLDVINKNPIPVSAVCNHCWNQADCFKGILRREPPQTCFVYDAYRASTGPKTVEQLVSETCQTRCVKRKEWKGDPIPHSEDYCKSHCPISGYILNRPKSHEDDIIKIGKY